MGKIFGKGSTPDLTAAATAQGAANRDTAPVSGRQEYLENLLNSYL